MSKEQLTSIVSAKCIFPLKCSPILLHKMNEEKKKQRCISNPRRRTITNVKIISKVNPFSMKNLNMTSTEFNILDFRLVLLYGNRLAIKKSTRRTWEREVQDRCTNEDKSIKAKIEALQNPRRERKTHRMYRYVFLLIFLLSCHTNCFTHYIHAALSLARGNKTKAFSFHF